MYNATRQASCWRETRSPFVVYAFQRLPRAGRKQRRDTVQRRISHIEPTSCLPASTRPASTDGPTAKMKPRKTPPASSRKLLHQLHTPPSPAPQLAAVAIKRKHRDDYETACDATQHDLPPSWLPVQKQKPEIPLAHRRLLPSLACSATVADMFCYRRCRLLLLTAT